MDVGPDDAMILSTVSHSGSKLVMLIPSSPITRPFARYPLSATCPVLSLQKFPTLLSESWPSKGTSTLPFK